MAGETSAVSGDASVHIHEHRVLPGYHGTETGPEVQQGLVHRRNLRKQGTAAGIVQSIDAVAQLQGRVVEEIAVVVPDRTHPRRDVQGVVMTGVHAVAGGYAQIGHIVTDAASIPVVAAVRTYAGLKFISLEKAAPAIGFAVGVPGPVAAAGREQAAHIAVASHVGIVARIDAHTEIPLQSRRPDEVEGRMETVAGARPEPEAAFAVGIRFRPHFKGVWSELIGTLVGLAEH